MYYLKPGLKIHIFCYCKDYYHKIIVIILLKFIPPFLHYSFNLAIWLNYCQLYSSVYPLRLMSDRFISVE